MHHSTNITPKSKAKRKKPNVTPSKTSHKKKKIKREMSPIKFDPSSIIGLDKSLIKEEPTLPKSEPKIDSSCTKGVAGSANLQKFLAKKEPKKVVQITPDKTLSWIRLRLMENNDSVSDKSTSVIRSANDNFPASLSYSKSMSTKNNIRSSSRLNLKTNNSALDAMNNKVTARDSSSFFTTSIKSISAACESFPYSNHQPSTVDMCLGRLLVEDFMNLDVSTRT